MKRDELVVSKPTESSLRDACAEFGRECRRLMEIASIGHLRVSFDLSIDPSNTGKFMGVKIDATRIQSKNFTYDEDLV